MYIMYIAHTVRYNMMCTYTIRRLFTERPVFSSEKCLGQLQNDVKYVRDALCIRVGVFCQHTFRVCPHVEHHKQRHSVRIPRTRTVHAVYSYLYMYMYTVYVHSPLAASRRQEHE